MIYLEVEDLLYLAEQATGAEPLVRDVGLLASAAARPQTNVFGHEPYPTVAQKAAALLCSLAQNHALVDGNKRLAFAAMLAFVRVNTGRLPEVDHDAAYDLVIGAATGALDVKDVAAFLWEAGVPDESG